MSKGTRHEGFAITENDDGSVGIHFPELDVDRERGDVNLLILPSFAHVGIMLEALQAHMRAPEQAIVVEETKE